MRAVLLLSAALVAAASTGCGDSSVPVTGKVTYNGQPIANARVTFVPVGEGEYGTASTNDQGAFDKVTKRNGEAGLAPGDYKVGVTVVKPRSENEPISYAPDPPPPFPARYIDSSTSDLQVSVGADGPTTVDLDLKD